MEKWNEYSKLILSAIEELKSKDKSKSDAIKALELAVIDLAEKQRLCKVESKNERRIDRLKHSIFVTFLGSVPTIIVGIILYVKYSSAITKLLNIK